MFDKVKKPITKGIADVPVVIQMEALECGAASLNMILGYYEKWISLEQVRIDCDVSRDGANAKNIVCAGINYGFDAKGYHYSLEGLKKGVKFPCIIHWDQAHFVVLKGFKGKKVYINDPSRGAVVLDEEEVKKHFTNVVLTFEPTEKFNKEGKKKNALASVLGKLSNFKSQALLMGLFTVIISIFSIVRPAFDRVYIDRIITHVNDSWTKWFFIGIITLSILQIIFSSLSNRYALKIRGKIDIMGSTTFLWKILRLPMRFFSQRQSGDIQNRQETNATISAILVTNVAPIFLDVIKMVLFLTIMIRYSLLLTMVGIVSVLINIIVSRIVSKKRVNLQRVQLNEESKLSTMTLVGIDTIDTIKSSGSEDGFFKTWADLQANVNNLRVESIKLNSFYGIIPNIITDLSSIIILILGGYLIIKGEFTVGMVLALNTYLTEFTGPTNNLIKTKEKFQEMATKVERVDDVMRYKEDPNINDRDFDGEIKSKLSGNIELKNVTFGYAKLSEPIIKDLSYKIDSGKIVAIVGKSGCGKSTLGKVISGLYTIDGGEITYDNKKLNEIDRNLFNSSMAIVDQDIVLYEDTIANNIKLWDKSIEDFEMILAARDAQIHEDIMSKNGGYDYYLSDGAREFSGGQRQRLEIARALAQEPSILIMDEFTSALDNKTEEQVVKAIKRRGITCIAITHKLSIIKECDEIVVMDKGKIVDSGTHEELSNRCDLYKDFLMNE